MYAISHAACALVLKRRTPHAFWWALLLSVQVIELVALLVWSVARLTGTQQAVAFSLAVVVLSHLVSDILQHAPDIYLLPAAVGPRLGLALGTYPVLDFGQNCF